MDIFNKTIDEIRDFAQSKGCRSWVIEKKQAWPAGGNRNIVIGDDVGLELGNPGKKSVAALVWTNDLDKITDGTITLVGPDIGENREKSLPFGKIVFVGIEGFDEDNTYQRYMEMEGARYDLDLKGYMIRAASKTQKEWCRISNEALKQGFCFDVIGSALMKKLKLNAYVKKVEFIFVTSQTEDVQSLQTITEPTIRVISAMNKMINEMALDCTTCDYNDVCSEVSMLSGMKDKLQKTKSGEAP